MEAVTQLAKSLHDERNKIIQNAICCSKTSADFIAPKKEVVAPPRKIVPSGRRDSKQARFILGEIISHVFSRRARNGIKDSALQMHRFPFHHQLEKHVSVVDLGMEGN